ncbi:solute carrier organic anion transporter family member 1C1-like [Lampetra planeri]
MDQTLPAPPVRRPRFANIKVFLLCLSLLFFSKAMSGSYMKSSITSIERHFNLPSSVAGIIDGGFEMGNLLVITAVSYFGARFHRPRIIAAGATLMGLGTLLIALPHFIMGRYDYQSHTYGEGPQWMCVPRDQQPSLPQEPTSAEPHSGSGGEGCQDKAQSSLWVLILVGNALRGIGESPITPLGISFLDDHARADNSAFYLGCVMTVGLIGPAVGFLVGSVCTKLFVDVGFVNMEEVTISPQDSRWVGAWWLGFLIAGGITLLTALPLWFFPASVPHEEELATAAAAVATVGDGRGDLDALSAGERAHEASGKEEGAHSANNEQRTVINTRGLDIVGHIAEAELAERNTVQDSAKNKYKASTELASRHTESYLRPENTEASLHLTPENIRSLAKDFLPSLRCLMANPVYVCMLINYVMLMNAFMGFFTFKAKYLEEQFGETASRSNLIIGAVSLPIVAIGIFLGGLMCKRAKPSLLSLALLVLAMEFPGFLLTLPYFFIGCGGARVAGVTVPYDGGTALPGGSLLAPCNAHCTCSSGAWDPVCGADGVTYASPCLAGCSVMRGSGRDTVYQECACIGAGGAHNSSALLEQCPREDDCHRKFILFMLSSSVAAFFNALAFTPSYTFFIRGIRKDLTSFALGIQTLITRVLAGIPAPIVFGAAIDSTCLKSSSGQACQGEGSCHVYDVNAYRRKQVALMTGFLGMSLLFTVLVVVLIWKDEKKAPRQGGAEVRAETHGATSSEFLNLPCIRTTGDQECLVSTVTSGLQGSKLDHGERSMRLPNAGGEGSLL